MIKYISKSNLEAALNKSIKVKYHANKTCMVKTLDEEGIQVPHIILDDTSMKLKPNYFVPCSRCWNKINALGNERIKKPKIDPALVNEKWPKEQQVTMYTTSDGQEFMNQVHALEYQIELYRKGRE